MKKLFALILSAVMLALPLTAQAAEATDNSPSIVDEEAVYVSFSGTDGGALAPGSSVTLHALALDKQEVKHVYVYYRMPEVGTVSFEMTPEDDDMYQYRLDIKDYHQSGTWKIAYFYVIDGEGNCTTISNKKLYSNVANSYDYSGGDFTVVSTEPDKEGPALVAGSVKITYPGSDSYAAPGEKAVLRAKFTDRAGVSRARACFTFGDTESVFDFVYDAQTDEYVAEIVIPSNTAAGAYKLSRLYAEDVVANSSTVSNPSAESLSVYKKEVVAPAPKPTVAVPVRTSFVSLRAGDKRFTAKWKKVNGVTGYQLQYSTKKSFKGAKTVTVKGAANVKKTVKKLKGKKYYVRIRTYKLLGKKKYCSAWSKTKTVEL